MCGAFAKEDRNSQSTRKSLEPRCRAVAVNEVSCLQPWIRIKREMDWTIVSEQYWENIMAWIIMGLNFVAIVLLLQWYRRNLQTRTICLQNYWTKPHQFGLNSHKLRLCSFKLRVHNGVQYIHNISAFVVFKIPVSYVLALVIGIKLYSCYGLRHQCKICNLQRVENYDNLTKDLR